MALQDLKFVQKDELVARVTEILGAKSKASIERRINAAGFNLEITRGDSLVLSDKEREKSNKKLVDNKNNGIKLDNILFIN